MQKTIKDLSIELGLSEKTIQEVYKSYWRFIRDTIRNIDFDNINTIEEYQRVKVNFNIPGIGKLGCPYDRMLRIKNQNRYKHAAKYKKDKTNVQSDSVYNE